MAPFGHRTLLCQEGPSAPWQTRLACPTPTPHPPFLGRPICYAAFWHILGLPYTACFHPCHPGSPLHVPACMASLRYPSHSILHRPAIFRRCRPFPTGHLLRQYLGSLHGNPLFPCPHWISTQQAAELFAATKALSFATQRRTFSLHLYLDNHATVYTILRGKASSPLIPQNRLLRRLCYLLHWTGLCAAIHYIPSKLNPADPPSRWWSFTDRLTLVTRTWTLGLAHLLHPPGPSGAYPEASRPRSNTLHTNILTPSQRSPSNPPPILVCASAPKPLEGGMGAKLRRPARGPWQGRFRLLCLQ